MYNEFIMNIVNDIIKRLFVTFISLEKAVTKLATGWFKMVKMDIFTLTN